MLLIEFADGTRLKMVGFGDAEGFGRQPDGLEVTELCGLNATMTPKTRRHVRSRRLPALRKSSDASRIELAPSLKFGPARSEECGFARGAGRVGATYNDLPLRCFKLVCD
jgi:hypothetical protein